jgi:PAS domain S-box-containing protein
MQNNDENNFLRIFQNNLVGMVLADDQHVIVDINKFMLQLTETNREDVIGKTLLHLGILNKEFVRAAWREFEGYEIIQNMELSLITKKGKKIFCLFSSESVPLNGRQYQLSAFIDITERKKAERELADVYERVTDGFVAFDKNWNYTYVNKTAGTMMDREPAQMIGKNVWDEFPHLVGSDIQEAYYRAMEKQEMVSLEQYFPPQQMWFLHMIYPSPEAMSVFFKDISFRKIDEKNIADSELRFRTLTKTAPVGIFETDAEGVTTYVNETWLEFTGLTLDEALGEGWLKVIHPDDRKKLITAWRERLKNKAASISEYRIIDSKGKLRWVYGKAIPIINNDGKVTGYIGTISDVTEVKLVLEQLQKSEASLNIAQSISKIGNWEFDLKTGGLFWSNEQYRIFELEGEPNETLYEAYRSKYHPDDLQKLDDVIKNAIEKSEGYVYEHRIICNDGSIKYILGIGEVILDHDGNVVGLKGTGQDITEQKLAEEKLTERTEQLRELSTHLQHVREEERLNISREIHDELGQQLTGLKMDIAWLMKKAGSDDVAVKNKFNDALLLLDTTIKSVRRISTELRPGIIDDLGLNASLEWIVQEFRLRLKADIIYENNFDDKDINPELSIGIFRILQESFTNIAKHARAKKISINIIETGQTVQITILDDGIGFDTNIKRNSLTFGLLGIRERTYMMKGDCVIYSRPGQGTKIEVKIPLQKTSQTLT